MWKIIILSAALAVYSVLLGAPAVSEAALQPLRGYAWSANIGWINFRGANYGVAVDTEDRFLQGYAWSANIGWIRFGEQIGKKAGYPANPQHGVKLTQQGNLIGWARVCSVTAPGEKCRQGVDEAALGWDGWIKFRGPGYKVRVNRTTCALRGWAWGGEVIGWIKFPGNGVKLDNCETMPFTDEVNGDGDNGGGGDGGGGDGGGDKGGLDPGDDGEKPPPMPPPSCSFSVSPRRVSLGGRAILSWQCGTTADSCAITPLASAGVSVNGSTATGPLSRSTNFTLTCVNAGGPANFSTSVSVVRPTYCEVIPFLGRCK